MCWQEGPLCVCVRGGGAPGRRGAVRRKMEQNKTKTKKSTAGLDFPGHRAHICGISSLFFLFFFSFFFY